jgi:hypothetical protein
VGSPAEKAICPEGPGGDASLAHQKPLKIAPSFASFSAVAALERVPYIP